MAKKRKPRLIEMVLALNESDLGMKKIGASPAAAPSPVDAQRQKMEVEAMIDCVSKYGQYGQALKRATTMQEVGTQLAQIAELAEQAVMSEADDSYDQHTLKRNMQEMKKYSGAFVKLAQEADMINQRMTAYYDDMGRILERYFELPPDDRDTPTPTGQNIPSGHSSTVVPPAGGDSAAVAAASDDEVQIDETALDDKELELSPQRPVKEKPSPNGSEMDHFADDSTSGGQAKETPPREAGSSKNFDQLTLKAIMSVHGRLKRENPELARRFSKLHPSKMEQVVWRLVK